MIIFQGRSKELFEKLLSLSALCYAPDLRGGVVVVTLFIPDADTFECVVASGLNSVTKSAQDVTRTSIDSVRLLLGRLIRIIPECRCISLSCLCVV